MTRLLLMFSLSVIRALIVSPVPSCPASCVVCSEDAIICHRLAHIIVAPVTTQALLLTEGSISTVQSASLSDLNNITVIGLSHNHISWLGEQSFRALPVLHTLLLDHNLLTSLALQEGALTNLTQLEVLALGHNLISMIRGGWLKGNRALRSLKLEGNLLTSIESGSFPRSDLSDLESLDLSDNLIHHLDRNSFDGLLSLHTLDLSRNRLSSAPVDAFNYLSWLTNLNVDLNTWNCSCQLLELATFLSSFIEQPGKTLYNGRRMVCVSADNPAVTTVLELTEANCVPSNQNITVQIERRGSVTPQLYARDLAITAVICFIGGVGLTLLVVLVYYQVHRRKKLKETKLQKEEEEGRSTAGHLYVNRFDVSEKRREVFLQTNGRKPWEREDVMLDRRSDGDEGQFRSRDEEQSRHLRCPDCSTAGQRGMGLNLNGWNDRINGGMERDEERETRRMKAMMEEERSRFETQLGILSRDAHNNTNSSSHPRTESFRPESLRTDMAGKSRALESVHCESCHKTYRPPEQNMRQGRNHRDSAVFDGFPSQYRQTDRYKNTNTSEAMRQRDLRRETRNVTFDLERLRTREQRRGRDVDNREEGEETFGDKERGRAKRHKAKVQSSRLLKVKLNLNPLGKSKVHPKRKTEQGNTDKSSPKRSKAKRYDGTEMEERRGKGSSGKDKKGSNKKIEKSSKADGSIEDGETEREEEESEEGKTGKNSTKQTGTSSNKGRSSKGRSEVKQGEQNSAPGNTTEAGDQPGSAPAAGLGQSLQTGNVQNQGAELVLRSAHHSLSLSDRNQSTNPSLLAPAGSQLSGSALSPQGGNFFLNTMTPRSAAPFPNTLSAPSMAPRGAPDSLIRQSGAGLVPPATSLQASTVHANPLQSSAMHTFPVHTSQPAGLASSSTANPAAAAPVQSSLQGHPPPDSPPLVATLTLDPGQGPGLQTGDGVHQLPTKETSSNSPQAPLRGEVLSGVTPQAPGPVIPVENLSNNKSQTETGHEAEGVSLTEGLAVGVSGGSMHSSDVPESGTGAPNMSTQSVSSTGDAAATPALLQQEYLSEEGGSSPRRKLRLVLPEKTSSRPPTALERKIR